MNDIYAMFIGLSILGVAGSVVYFMYTYTRLFKQIVDKEERYCLLEESLINNIALKKGIDIEKLKLKRSIMNKSRYNLRKRLEQEIYEELFGKEKSSK